MLFLISSTGLQNNRRTKQISYIFTYIYLDKANTTTALSGVIILSLSLFFSLSLSLSAVCLSISLCSTDQSSEAIVHCSATVGPVERHLHLRQGVFAATYSAILR